MTVGNIPSTAKPRRLPYIYVTWLTKVLAGEASCEFAPWFKAHYQHDKLPSDFNLAQWQAEHTELVRSTADTLRTEGYHPVKVEDQNTFRVTSDDGSFCLAGKPDIVATAEHRVLVIDCKTGAARDSDIIQVQIYQAVLARVPAYHGLPIEGRVQYRDRATDIPAHSVDRAFAHRLRRIATAVGSAQALPAVPSGRECGWCDISAADCSARQERSELPVITNHGLF